MKLGFTGARTGMNHSQRTRLTPYLLTATEVHHGDCVGADAQFHECAISTRHFKTGEQPKIVIHPPEDPRMRAFCGGYTTLLKPKDYIERNHDIVDACDILIAAPSEMYEKLRSGTWATVRYARKLGKRIVILYPNGTHISQLIAWMVLLFLASCGRQQAGCTVTYTNPTQVSVTTCPYGSVVTGQLGNGILQCSTVSVACDKGELK